ncbi:MAG TPA: hypothetical protein VFV38_31385 [Ktedonobacteraceae bacterium]|nr:hypothetical protein [Ktedonobacteraceae bacterium]
MTTWKFDSKPISFYIGQYISGGGTAVEAMYKGEYFLAVSAKMPHAPRLPNGQFYLKTWSENEDMTRAMIEEGIIEQVIPPVVAHSGFVTAYAYQFTKLGTKYCKKID